MLPGHKHHLLLFNKTEQSCATLSWTELNVQDQLNRVLIADLQEFVQTIGPPFCSFLCHLTFSPIQEKLTQNEGCPVYGDRCVSISPMEEWFK